MIDLILFKILVLILGLPSCLDRDALSSQDHITSCYIDQDFNKTIIVEDEIIFSMSYGVRLK